MSSVHVTYLLDIIFSQKIKDVNNFTSGRSYKLLNNRFNHYATQDFNLSFFFCFSHPVPPFGPTILCTPCSCCLKPPLDVNPALHILHEKVFSPVWLLSWASRFFSVFINFEQNLHWNLGFSCDNSWALAMLNPPKRFPQYLQLYFSSEECTSFLWL